MGVRWVMVKPAVQEAIRIRISPAPRPVPHSTTSVGVSDAPMKAAKVSVDGTGVVSVSVTVSVTVGGVCARAGRNGNPARRTPARADRTSAMGNRPEH